MTNSIEYNIGTNIKIAIILVGYNRPNALYQLFDSVKNANYKELKTDLIISLDYCDKQNEQKNYFENMLWCHGKKIIRTFEKRQGLKKHILQCGEYTKEYDAVIVLEDDLIVSRDYFIYAYEAINRYKENELVAGISLYTHKTNPGNGRFFEPEYNGYDTFFMQYAQSWGQCWTKKMWLKFIQWYTEHSGMLEADGTVPKYILHWNDCSWLKYFIKYTVDTNRFFIYPYYSLTTNNSEKGEHNTNSSSSFQVAMQNGIERSFLFPDLENGIKYDVFFERIFDEKYMQELPGEKIIDLYGLKYDFSKGDILITTRVFSYRLLKEIALKYRPHEINCIKYSEGKGIYVYDLNSSGSLKKNIYDYISEYELKAISAKLTLLHGLKGVLKSIKYRIKKYLKE